MSKPVPRGRRQRQLYLDAALARIPRLLGAIDRNPYRPTYGCFDREYWHYRTAGFASEMFQEAVLPLALVYTHPLPGNRWHGNPAVRELVIAALEFSARNCHADGSCDDYYPFERALGAAVFSLQAAARAYELLRLDLPRVRAWLKRRARWVMDHDESGRLANHQALAALGLARVARITGGEEYRQAAQQRVRKLLTWQSAEGWFEEYGGADPGYQTVTIDCLARLRRSTGDESLDEPLERAVAFARHFLHPDDSYGGPYGSRGTRHFFAHGFELLAGRNGQAAELADAFLRSLAAGKQAWFEDDRMYVHRLSDLIEAYQDWSATCPGSEEPRDSSAAQAATTTQQSTWFPHAGMLICRQAGTHLVVSAARGGTFTRHREQHRPITDAGLIVEMAGGRIAVSQTHGAHRNVEWDEHRRVLHVSGPLCWVRFEAASPVKLALFHLGMWSIGRFCRTAVRKLLQRRLITGRRECPVRLTRTFEFAPDKAHPSAPSCRITDRVEITQRRLRVRRMAFSADLEAGYVAASDVYQDAVLHPWQDLAAHAAELNATGRTTIVRDL